MFGFLLYIFTLLLGVLSWVFGFLKSVRILFVFLGYFFEKSGFFGYFCNLIGMHMSTFIA